jgi:hypothetical protein
MQDELYLAKCLPMMVEPLLTCDAAFTRDHFWSADLAVRGRCSVAMAGTIRPVHR